MTNKSGYGPRFGDFIRINIYSDSSNRDGDGSGHMEEDITNGIENEKDITEGIESEKDTTIGMVKDKPNTHVDKLYWIRISGREFLFLSQYFIDHTFSV